MTKNSQKAAARLLLKARDLMNDKGRHWAKGYLRKGDGDDQAFCAMGGVAQAIGVFPRGAFNYFPEAELEELPPRAQVAIMALAEAISGEVPESIDDAQDVVMTFNDGHDTTWGQVSRKFRTAARRLEKAATA